MECSPPTTDNEEKSSVEFDLAALHIHEEEEEGSESQSPEPKAAATKKKSLFPSRAESVAIVKARAAAMAIGEGDKARAAELAARAEARKGRTRMVRLSKEDVDVLIANSKNARPLRVNHEFIDRLTCLSPEMREEMRAARTIFVENMQAIRDIEKDLIDKYHTDGYAEVEVDIDDDTDDSLPWEH